MSKRKTKNNLVLKKFSPINQKQKIGLDIWLNTKKHIVLHGSAGTGKTFLALNFAAMELPKRIVIVRNVVQTRNMGFLPGTEEEKKEVFETPYRSIFSEMYGRGDAYDILKKKGTVMSPLWKYTIKIKC